MKNMNSILRLLVIVIIVVLLASLLDFKCSPNLGFPEIGEKQDKPVVDSTLQERIYTVTDSLGREITRYKALAVQYSRLAATNSSKLQDLKERLTQANLKLSNLRSSVEIATTTTDTIHISTADTIYLTDRVFPIQDTLEYNYKGDWLDFTGVIGTTIDRNFVSLNNIAVGFNVINEVNLDILDTKTPFFGNPKVDILIRNSNPHTKTQSVQTYITPRTGKNKFLHHLISFGAGAITGYAIRSINQ